MVYRIMFALEYTENPSLMGIFGRHPIPYTGTGMTSITMESCESDAPPIHLLLMHQIYSPVFLGLAIPANSELMIRSHAAFANMILNRK
jgi:hypothetical protein